jgi:hypothetical protein
VDVLQIEKGLDLAHRNRNLHGLLSLERSVAKSASLGIAWRVFGCLEEASGLLTQLAPAALVLREGRARLNCKQSHKSFTPESHCNEIFKSIASALISCASEASEELLKNLKLLTMISPSPGRYPHRRHATVRRARVRSRESPLHKLAKMGHNASFREDLRPISLDNRSAATSVKHRTELHQVGPRCRVRCSCRSYSA